MTAAEELLLRIGRAAIRVDELRGRQAAAKRARNKIGCRWEGNLHGGAFHVDPCWKQRREVAVYHDAPDLVPVPLEEQCHGCQRRLIRQHAFAAESGRLAGARRRVTMLARRYRRDFGEAAVQSQRP